MPIEREYKTSNQLVRDALAALPIPAGDRAGDFVAPDFPIDAEVVSNVVMAEHSLDLDDLRSEDAPANSVRFETGGTTDISVVERGKTFTIGSRKIEEAGARGVDVVAQRSELIRNDILDAKEYRIATMVMSPGNYAPGHKEAGVNLATANLIKKFDTWQDAIRSGRWGTARFLLLGRNAWRGMRVNEGFIKYVSTPGVTESGSRQRRLAALAEYLELDEVRVADFSRVLSNSNNLPTDFWDPNSAILFVRNKTLSNRTLAQVPVVPYGQAQNVAEGTVVDVRTAKLAGTGELTEVGVYHRYKPYLLNANLAFLLTGVTGWEDVA